MEPALEKLVPTSVGFSPLYRPLGLHDLIFPFAVLTSQSRDDGVSLSAHLNSAPGFSASKGLPPALGGPMPNAGFSCPQAPGANLLQSRC